MSLKNRLCCDTCIHTTKKGCGLFKTSEEVWDRCLGGSVKIKPPKGWIKPMAYAYTHWEPYENKILPDILFEI